MGRFAIRRRRLGVRHGRGRRGDGRSGVKRSSGSWTIRLSFAARPASIDFSRSVAGIWILVAEYQRDGLGAATSDDYLDVVFSDPFRRGELQAFGRDETALQLSYQIHPLWNVAGLWLWNLNDRSALLFPSLAYSLSNEASFTGGVAFGLGADESTLTRPLPSGARSRRHDGVRVAQLVLLTDRRAQAGLEALPHNR